jgi:hypothetical protein
MAPALLLTPERETQVPFKHLRLRIRQPVEHCWPGGIHGYIHAAYAAIGHINPVGAEAGGQTIGLRLEPPAFAGRQRQAQHSRAVVVRQIRRIDRTQRVSKGYHVAGNEDISSYTHFRRCWRNAVSATVRTTEHLRDNSWHGLFYTGPAKQKTESHGMILSAQQRGMISKLRARLF